MEIKINGLIPRNGRLKWMEIFGYTSKGNPGLEVTGFSSKSRGLKEKMIFLSKRRRLQFPLRRYVLCLECEDLGKGDVEWLELPTLLAFWSLTGNLPLKRLDNCFASAKVSLEGELDFLDMNEKIWKSIDGQLKKKSKEVIFIGNDSAQSTDYVFNINATKLLNEHIGHFY